MKFFLFLFHLVRATLTTSNLGDLIAILDAFWAKVQRMAELTHPDMNPLPAFRANKFRRSIARARGLGETTTVALEAASGLLLLDAA